MHNPDAIYAEDWDRHQDRNRITGLPVDPVTLFVYWAVNDERRAHISRHFNTSWENLSLSLHLYDVTDRWFNGTNAAVVQQAPVQCSTDNWYFRNLNSNRNYVVDLVIPVHDHWFTILRSNVISLPPRTTEKVQPQVKFVAIPNHGTMRFPTFDGYHIHEARGENQ